MSSGGKIFMTATCDASAISINFEYHARDDKTSAFKAQGTGQYVHILYRLDQGAVQDTASSTSYQNTADADFSYGSDEPSAPMGAGSIAAAGAQGFIKALAPWLGPQDLRAFLHAHEATFELPLGNGTTEIVVIYPQDSSFQKFVSSCNIDLRKFDEDAAKAKTQAQSNASDQTEASAQPSRQEAAADAAIRAAAQSAIYGDCAMGDRTLVVGRATPLGSKSRGQSQSAPIIPAGVEVTTIANDDAAISGRCEIEYMDGGNKIHGFVPMASLVRSPAPASAPQN
jgi:hypothetical protein